MCYYVDQKANLLAARTRFNTEIKEYDSYHEGTFINGFSHPNIPIITNSSPDVITTDHIWGLIPSWSKDIEFRKNTLNARIETIEEKPSFKNVTNNRCLIIATSFYEWRWLDEKGKSKERYQIYSQEQEVFAFAGLYSSWTNPANGDVMQTYTMITTQANELMEYIHNHKKRMPLIIKREDEKAWLDTNNKIKDFAYPYQDNIVGFKIK